MSIRVELCQRIAEAMVSVNLSAYTIGLLWYGVELNDAELHLISIINEQDLKTIDNGDMP